MPAAVDHEDVRECGGVTRRQSLDRTVVKAFVGFLDKPHTMVSLEMLLASSAQYTPQLGASAAGTPSTAIH